MGKVDGVISRDLADLLARPMGDAYGVFVRVFHGKRCSRRRAQG